jgi:hypothetical protein
MLNMPIDPILRECIEAAEPNRPSHSGEFRKRFDDEMAKRGYKLPEWTTFDFTMADVTTMADDPLDRLYLPVGFEVTYNQPIS